MSISSDFNFVENDKIFLELNKDTLELKCSLDIDGSIYSGSNEIINANSPEDFNYYYTLYIRTKNGYTKFTQKEFVELKETTTSGVYSFDIKDFKKNLYDIVEKFITDNLATTLLVNLTEEFPGLRPRLDYLDFNSITEFFEGLDIIDVTLSVFYIDKNVDLPSLPFVNNENFSEIETNFVKREKFIIPPMDKQSVFFVSETNNFPYKYEISWDKIKLFKEFLVTLYCGTEKLLIFKTTETKIDLFNFKADNKTYNLKDLLGARANASNFKIEIIMIDSNISNIDESYTFAYNGANTTVDNTLSLRPYIVTWPAEASIAESTDVAPIRNSSSAIFFPIFLKYRTFFPNQTYTFTFAIDWSKYKNNKLTHIHNKVARSDSTLVFDIVAQEYPFKVLYLFGNADIIVILRDILAFLFTFPWDVLKDIGVTIKDILCCLNIDLNLGARNSNNKLMTMLYTISKNPSVLSSLMRYISSAGTVNVNADTLADILADYLPPNTVAPAPNTVAPADTSETLASTISAMAGMVATAIDCRSDTEGDSSPWNEILHDCIDSCKKLPTSDHHSKPCSNSSETTFKERNCNLRNTLILLQEKIIQFNNLLPRVMAGTYVFNNKEDKLGFYSLNNGTPYALATISYSYILNVINASNDDTILNSTVKKYIDNNNELLKSKLFSIEKKITDYKNRIIIINTLIEANNALYNTTYRTYIEAINNGASTTQLYATLTSLTGKNTTLETELSSINNLISPLVNQALALNFTMNTDINKTSTINLVNNPPFAFQLSIDSPSANPNSYIIKFIDEKNVDTLNFKETNNQPCKPQTSSNLLHTFANNF